MCLIGRGGEIARVVGRAVADDLDPDETGNPFFVPAAGDVARVPKFISVFLRSDSGFRTIAPAFDSFDGVAACNGTGAATSSAVIAVVR